MENSPQNKTGLKNRDEYLRHKEWFIKKYPYLPFMLHPDLVKEYNQKKTSGNKLNTLPEQEA